MGGFAIKIESTFTAYVDEAGDEGYHFVPRPDRRSSEWFILSAVICRTDRISDIELSVAAFDFMHGKQRAKFHFQKAAHEECVAFANMINELPVAAISIFAHKPSIREDAALRTGKHMLFDYCAKLLIERISWYCDRHKGRDQGLAEIVFSYRRQLKIERIQRYLLHLRGMTDFYAESPVPREARNDIRWNVISPGMIDVQPHDSLPGLQVADAVVSSCARAVEFSRFSTTEHRFVKILRPVFWTYGLRCRSYGIKFVPAFPTDEPGEPKRFHWLRRFP